MKNKKNLIKIIIVLSLLLIIVGIIIGLTTKSNGIKLYSKNTQINDKTYGYRFDLRIYGTYENKTINETIYVSNYKNTDKSISVTNVSDKISNSENDTQNDKKEYIVKDKKYYIQEESGLKEIKSVPYEDTDIYLKGIEKIKKVKQIENQKIGENEYRVYTGEISKRIINKILASTDLGIKVKSPTECEVWVTKDNYVYKVYYRVGKLTIYASYFGYNITREIDLNYYNNQK